MSSPGHSPVHSPNPNPTPTTDGVSTPPAAFDFPPTSPQLFPPKSPIVPYLAKSGVWLDFNASENACAPFGFFANQRVQTPKGIATVIGVNEGDLWFHLDGDRGASRWEGCRSYEDLLKQDIYVVEDLNTKPPPVVQVLQWGEYKLKRIDYMGRTVRIVLQNENGPCPLIAIANILALKGFIEFQTSDNVISVKEVVDMISQFLKDQVIHGATEENKKHIETAIENMHQLQYGLDVNCGFTSCDSFEKTERTKIFDFLGIRMLHGWVVDPQDPVSKIIGKDTYEDLTLKLVTSMSDDSPKLYTEEQVLFVQQFLDSTGHQLTEYGLQLLHTTMQPDELAVLFRNNHFSTLTLHNGKLFNLVSDLGYERERNIAWDLLSSVFGDSQFFSGTFQSSEDVKKDEVINTALEFGFARDQILKAIQAVSRSNDDLQMDEVLQWLQLHAPM